MLTFAMIALGRIIFPLVMFAAWVERKLHPQTPLTLPEVDVQRRVYEWEDTSWCGGCKKQTTHRFIEWTGHDGFVVTDECKTCGVEVVTDMKTEFE